MDPRRFDNWTRNRAAKLSRRNALRLASASAVTLLPATRTRAQNGAPCQLTVRARIAGGPSAPESFDGTLAFTVDTQGTLVDATFATADDVFPVTGVATGRAIDLQIERSADALLVLVGVADTPVADCPRAVGGLISGPQPGDLGGWEGTATGSSSSAGGNTTAIPPDNGGSCGAPLFACGPNCCPEGGTCIDAVGGTCACPEGTEQCDRSCVASCPENSSLNLDTCTCSLGDDCLLTESACVEHSECCSGFCDGGTCKECAGIVCGEFGCVDPNTSNLNCGRCGNFCPAPQICTAGVCGCGAEQAPCSDHLQCCAGLCFNGTCVTCSNVTMNSGQPGTFCGTGICVDLQEDVKHCGGCFEACAQTSSAVRCVAGVCHDTNSDPNACGYVALAFCVAGQSCVLGQCI